MQSSSQDGNMANYPRYNSSYQIKHTAPFIPEQIIGDDHIKARRIKKLMIMNQQLIETLKIQDQQLTRKIKQQKTLKSQHRSFSVKDKPVNLSVRQSASTKKQLSNVYKQIQMYKSVVQNLKDKQLSPDAMDKLKICEGRTKMEQQKIQNLQVQLKTLITRRDQQTKQLDKFQNQKLKKSVTDLDQKAGKLKQKYKNMKKQLMDRQQVERRYQAYQIQLEKTLRKANNKFYPGLPDKATSQEEIITDISPQEWQTVKSQVEELKSIHQQNIKKLDHVHRMKLREVKSLQENQLKLKQKLRTFENLKNKANQITKLVVVRQGLEIELPKKKKKPAVEQKQEEGQEEQEQEKPKTKEQIMKEAREKALKRSRQNQHSNMREVKRWAIPQGYCLQKGKILPDAIFFSDKPVLKDVKKSKIISVKVWADSSGILTALQFFYKDQNDTQYEGTQPIQNLPATLNTTLWSLTEGDYLSSLYGQFSDSQLSSLTMKSRFGKEITFASDSHQKGDQFKFQPKVDEIPSCFFGAYVRIEDDKYVLCHIGCEFIKDW